MYPKYEKSKIWYKTYWYFNQNSVKTETFWEQFGAKYSRMDQVKFAYESLQKNIASNFLKAVFHKFYLVHSWILYLIYSWTNEVSSQPPFTCSKVKIETLEKGVKYIQS